jgi:hypothetical protein
MSYEAVRLQYLVSFISCHLLRRYSMTINDLFNDLMTFSMTNLFIT